MSTTLPSLSDGFIVIDSLLRKDSRASLSYEDRFWGQDFLHDNLQIFFIVCFKNVDTLGLVFNGGNFVNVFLNKIIDFVLIY